MSQRQLKAVMFTDLVGFSTWMQSVEVMTSLATTSTSRRELNRLQVPVGSVLQLPCMRRFGVKSIRRLTLWGNQYSVLYPPGNRVSRISPTLLLSSVQSHPRSPPV